MRDSSKSLFYFFTTILCLTVFSAALLISEDVLQLDISGDTIDFGNNTGVVSDADSADTSPGISLTLHDEKLEKLKSQSLGGIVALAVGVVFSLLVAMLQPSMALLFLLAAFLLVAGMGISFGRLLILLLLRFLSVWQRCLPATCFVNYCNALPIAAKSDIFSNPMYLQI